MLSNRIGDYWYISQGKTRIPGVNDAADMEETDVSPTPGCAKKISTNFSRRFPPLPPPSPSSFFSFSWRIEGGRWKKLGRGFRHPLAPRLRKLAAAAIGVRGDWGRKGIGRIGFEMRKDSNGTFPPRHPLPDQLRLTFSLSPAFLSARFAHEIFVRTEQERIDQIYDRYMRI